MCIYTHKGRTSNFHGREDQLSWSKRLQGERQWSPMSCPSTENVVNNLNICYIFTAILEDIYF